jgi:hypothetical protein
LSAAIDEKSFLNDEAEILGAAPPELLEDELDVELELDELPQPAARTAIAIEGTRARFQLFTEDLLSAGAPTTPT